MNPTPVSTPQGGKPYVLAVHPWRYADAILRTLVGRTAAREALRDALRSVPSATDLRDDEVWLAFGLRDVPEALRDADHVRAFVGAWARLFLVVSSHDLEATEIDRASHVATLVIDAGDALASVVSVDIRIARLGPRAFRAVLPRERMLTSVELPLLIRWAEGELALERRRPERRFTISSSGVRKLEK